jgi:glycosyltransferase involved in cell wall biosynthesis
VEISIVTPALRNDVFLVEAIQSVYDQRDDKYCINHIVVFDDESVELPNNISNLYYNLTYIKCAGYKNGPSFARNSALLNISSGLVYFLDSDDLWPPNYIKKTHVLYGNKDVVAVSTKGYKFVDGGPTDVLSQIYVKDGPINNYVAWNVIGCPSGFSFNLDSVSEKILFDEELFFFEDWVFYLKLMYLNQRKVLLRTNEVFFFYRLNSLQATNKVNIMLLNKSFHAMKSWSKTLNYLDRFNFVIQRFRLYFLLRYGVFGRIFAAVTSILIPSYFFLKIRSLFK